MTINLRRFAFCIGVDENDGSCLMVYEDNLNAIEVRSIFAGAQKGKWYRTNLRKDAQRWEAVEEERLLVRTVTRINARDGAAKQLIQICLPIFFVPSFKCFGCAWRVAPPAALCDKMHFNFFSPCLDSPGQINFSAERLAELDIRPGEQLQAFLTLDFRGPESSIKPPKWTFDAAEDLQKGLADPLFSQRSVSLGTQKEWGVLLDLVVDANDHWGAILCLRDGNLALGRILRVDGSSDLCEAQVGDVVGFNSIELDCFNHPIRMAMNLLAYKSSQLASDDSNYLNQFPQDALPDLPSVKLIAKRAEKKGQHIFELCFGIDESHMLSLRMGSVRVGRLGVLIDLNGELLSAWDNIMVKDANSVSTLLARVKARFCLTLEQQQPLWLLDQMLEITKLQNDTDNEQKQQSLKEQNSTGINSQTSESQCKWVDGRSSAEPNWNGQVNDITVQDGAFGASVVSNRLKQKCQHYASNTSLHTQGKSQQFQKQTMKAIVVCTRLKGEEMGLAFYDEQQKRFTRSAFTKINKVPLLSGQTSPKPGQWFQISYQNYNTSQHVSVTKSVHLTDLSHLPAHLINQENSKLWDKLVDGKFNEIGLWDEPTTERGGSVASQLVENGEVKTAHQQQQQPLMSKSMQPIKRNTPVPVTNVFMRPITHQTTTTEWKK